MNVFCFIADFMYQATADDDQELLGDESGLSYYLLNARISFALKETQTYILRKHQC